MIAFAHRRVFWLGIAAVSTGVALHLPMYISARDMGYRLAGMPMDLSMKTGMALIIVGIALSGYGLVPRGAGAYPDRVAGVRVAALDEARIRPAHLALLAVMAVAVTIDVMKPTTLAFVVPGVAQEYGLKSPLNPQGQVPVALLPLCALVGMVLGSAGWGWLGDRIGRRASILLAGVMFIATSICGAMPAFGWNLLMCFLMGAAVGGMLPIAFALLAETIPARHRSWLMVLIGGDVAGAYIVTSLLASTLEPRFGWRVLWLIGLPTGVLLILLNRWIPESPRFLLASGRAAEAEAVMARFGARLVHEDPAPRSDEEPRRYVQLFRGPFGGLTTAVVLFGLGWGLVNSGFLLWLPTNLRQLGLEAGASERLLAGAAIIGFPAVFAVALLYGFWSSRRTMIGVVLLTSATLFSFVALGRRVGDHPYVLQALIVLLLVGTNSILAVLTPYSSEVYPTRVRARGTGLAGACSCRGTAGAVPASRRWPTSGSVTGGRTSRAASSSSCLERSWCGTHGDSVCASAISKRRSGIPELPSTCPWRPTGGVSRGQRRNMVGHGRRPRARQQLPPYPRGRARTRSERSAAALRGGCRDGNRLRLSGFAFLGLRYLQTCGPAGALRRPPTDQGRTPVGAPPVHRQAGRDRVGQHDPGAHPTNPEARIHQVQGPDNDRQLRLSPDPHAP